MYDFDLNEFISNPINGVIQFKRNMDAENERWKDKLRKEWRDSMKLPRKQKKQRRKEILLDWSIACWMPEFDMDFDKFFDDL